MRRVVLDSNVLISARLSPTGAPGRLLEAWLDGRFELIVSPVLLAELAGVLERPKFRRWLTIEEAHAFVERLRVSATRIADPPQQHHGLRDPTTPISSHWRGVPKRIAWSQATPTSRA
jgi:uncharacterized protein